MADVIRACTQHGANVAEIRDQAANDAILEIRQTQNGLIVSSGNDEAEEGKWVWPSDGQLFYKVIKRSKDLRRESAGQYQMWVTSPKNKIAPDYDANVNCMTMVASGVNKGKWHNTGCSARYVVCEAPVVKGRAIYLEQVPPME